MTTWNVSSASQLSAALSSASGGDEIVLANGNYGTFTFSNRDYSSYVTVRAATEGGAVFSQLNVFDSSFLRIDGVHVSAPTNGGDTSRVVDIERSNNIEFINSEVNGLVNSKYDDFYGIYVLDNDNVTLRNNYVHDVQNGILLFASNNVVAADNHVNFIGSDGFKFGGLNGYLIENNISGGLYFPLAGDHVDFIQGQGSSSNGIIRGNVHLAANQGGAIAQGIFVADGTYDNIIIEQNIISTGMGNGIILDPGSGTRIVQNNTLINVPGLVHGGTWITVVGSAQVKNNVTSGSQGSIGTNEIVMQSTNPNGVAYYDDLFVNADKGLGLTLADLKPVAGSPVDFGSGKGAEQRLHELLFDTDPGPNAAIATFSTDSGVVGDGITNDSTLTLTGTAEASSTVKVYDGAALLGQTTANGSGAWSYTTTALADGSHSLTATATSGGTTSPASSPKLVTVDTVAPSAPAIVSFSTDTGTVGDGITSDNTLTLTGTAAANSTVKVYDGATLLGTTTANGSGAWSYTTPTLSNATHSFTATATDAAGNTGAASAALAVTVNTTAPSPPTTITSFSTDTGTVGDGITSDNTLTLTGTAAANSTVKVYDGATQIGTATANGNGNWSYTTGTLANGTHSFTAAASPVSAPVIVTVDTVAPSAPAIAAFSNDTGTVGDGITSDNTLTLTGTAAANSTVKVYDGATLLGQTTANSNGAWSYTTGTLANTTHSFTATAMDVAGNTSAASTALSVTVNTTAASSPTIAAFSTDSGTAGDGITNDNTLTLTGTAAANSTVTVYDGTTLLGTATANGSGAWSYTTGTLANGNHSFTATSTSGGMTSPASSPKLVTVDTVAPSAPAIAAFSTDTGTVGDGITSDNTLTLTGTAAANSTVKVYDGATQIGTAIANGSGAWSYTTGTLSNTTHSFTATAVDAAGNTGAASAALSITVDRVAPSAPAIAAFSNDTGTVGDGITSDNTLTLTGTAAANSTVRVYDGTTLLGTATANTSGAWSYTTGTLANATHSFTATAMDAAGNTSAASAVLNVAVDNHVPVTSVSNANLHASSSQPIPVSSLFSASDADNDPLVYLFYDQTKGSGHFELNGVVQHDGDGQYFAVSAANLANLTFVPGQSGSDTLGFGATDQKSFSGWTSVQVSAPVNHAGVVTVPDTDLHPLSSKPIQVSSLLSASDADNDTLVYLFYDQTKGGGHFELNGVVQHDGDGQYFAVSAANLANLTFVPGQSGSDNLGFGVTDQKSFGGWTPVTVNAPVNHVPVVTVPNTDLHPSSSQPIQVSGLFSASDADNDPLVYLFYDQTKGGGHFELNGVVQHDGDGQYFAVSAANLADLTFVPGQSGSDSLGFGVTDLKSFSGWTPVSIQAPIHQASALFDLAPLT